MIRSGTINTNNNSGSSSVSLTANYAIRGYSRFTPQDELFPLFDLPINLQGLYWYNSRLVIKPYQAFPYNAKVGNVPLPEVTIAFPEADKILTEYIEKYLKLRFTIEILKFNGVKAGIPQSSTESDKFGIKYDIDITKALARESYGTAGANYEKQYQKTMAYYTGHQGRLYELYDKTTILKLEYINKLQQIGYKDNGEDKKIILSEAASFISDVNRFVNGKLGEYIRMLQRISVSEGNF